MRKRLWSIIFFSLVFLTAPHFLFNSLQQEENHTLIILDLSQSMKKKMGRMTRIEAARQVFGEVLTDLPDNTMLALRLLGHIGDRSTACQETELVIPFQSGNYKKIIETIEQAKPLGQKTPLHFTLKQALEDFKGLKGKNKIILLSDGEETCQADPEELAGLFKDLNIPIDTIGIGDDLGFSQLGGIALDSGGNFYLGGNFDSLKEALQGSMGGSGTGAGLEKPRKSAEQKIGKQKSQTSKTSSVPSVKPGSMMTMMDPSSLVRIIPIPSMEEEKNRDIQEAKETSKQKDPATTLLPEQPQPSVSPLMHVEIIFDASGSMAQRLEGKTKMELAKRALDETLGPLDSRLISLSFRAFGFDTSIPQEDTQSCLNSELLVDFGSQNTEAIKRNAANLIAHGNTPIARSLQLAGDDLLPFKDKNPYVLLISDGNETCGGDPVKVIETLRQKGIPVSVYVIGFDLEDQHKTQLEKIAQAGNGRYYDAQTYSSLSQSLRDFAGEMDQKARSEERNLKSIIPVSGGPDISQAVPLKPGRYRLKNRLQKGEWVYFQVSSSKGQRTLIKNTSRETRRFTAAVLGSDGKKIAGRTAVASGKTGTMSYTQYMDTTGDGFYLAVGDDYSDVEKDAFFEIKIQEGGDIYVGLEAPEKPEPAAIPLPYEGTSYAHLGLEDRADVFVVDLKQGDFSKGIDISLFFAERDFRFLVEVFDGSQKRLHLFTKLNGNADLDIPFSKDQDVVYIKIVDNNPSLYHLFSSYSMKIRGLTDKQE